MSGFDFLEKVKSHPEMSDLPIIVYTGKQLTATEETRIKKYAETIIVKDVKSPERLLDETALFLHRVEAKLPDNKRKMLEQLHDADVVISGKNVLIVDGILMDGIMAEMDGYDTMRAIREIPEFKALPIIALTAKAMKGDREKCITAGASDYITKPVDTEQLISLLRVWLYK